MRWIIDTHTHLYDLSDPFAVLADCAAAGVSDVVALGVDLASNRRHLEIRNSALGTSHLTLDTGHSSVQGGREFLVPSAKCLVSPSIHLALGLHPGNITTHQDTEACFEFMRAHIREAKAVGETGLDFWYKGVRKDDDKKREQRDVFSRHLALAREFDLPIVIHSRGAWQECLEMACSAKVRKAEFHWYSGPVDVLKDIIDAGFLISCTPALAYSPELRKAVEFAPLERIMVETDTPVSYSKTLDTGHWTLETDVQKPTSSVECQVSSVSKDSKIPSTPKDVWRTLRLLSSIKGRSEDDVLAAVERNARDFFKIGTR